MALAQQSMFRASRLEAGLFTTGLNETLDTGDHPFTPMSKELAGVADINIARAQNRNYCLADGFLRLVRQSNGWSLFLRYQAQSERLYRRALEEFDRLKALRPELPNEPISDPQPQPDPATYPSSETNPPPPENLSSAPTPAPGPIADSSSRPPRPSRRSPCAARSVPPGRHRPVHFAFRRPPLPVAPSRARQPVCISHGYYR
jgi:hypothetical protein